MEWKIADKLIAYPDALQVMEERVAQIAAGHSPELVWLLEHPPLYTGGTSASEADLIDRKRFPFYHTGRGGQWTYHGPGQCVGYVMLDLKKRALPGTPDIRQYVKQLEQWIIDTLADFGIQGFIREGRVGVWVIDRDGQEAKIAAIGIRLRKWVSYHGICLNVSPELSHYEGIVPCGISQYGVTSLSALGVKSSVQEVNALLQKHFAAIFN